MNFALKKIKLAELRQLIAYPKRESLSCSFLETGIPKGAMTAISGQGKSSLATQFLSEHPNLNAAWVENNFSIYPFAFQQKKIQLNRLLFVECGKEIEWTCLQILKSQAFSILILYVSFLSLSSLRRLQLAAEKADVSLVWLTSRPQNFWPIRLEVSVHKKNQQLQIKIIKQRY